MWSSKWSKRSNNKKKSIKKIFHTLIKKLERDITVPFFRGAMLHSTLFPFSKSTIPFFFPKRVLCFLPLTLKHIAKYPFFVSNYFSGICFQNRGLMWKGYCAKNCKVPFFGVAMLQSTLFTGCHVAKYPFFGVPCCKVPFCF